MNSLRSKAINIAAKRIVAIYYILFLIGIACQREQPPIEPRKHIATAYVRDSLLIKEKYILEALSQGKHK